jgi:acyl carrier protein
MLAKKTQDDTARVADRAEGRPERVALSKGEIFAVIRRIMVERFSFPSELIVPEARIKEDLDLDSLDSVDLISQLEEETGYDLDDDQLEGMQCLQDLVDVLDGELTAEVA